ncbi:MAG TPA: DUF2911 domain-containing protein [Blastocatellia bacterium]|nr:DUF2911 domain-containing protein [Blastocatellia bacterium]
MDIRRVMLWTAAVMVCFVSVIMAQTDRGTAEATINGKKVTISYGRPSINGPALKGKDLFTVAPVGTVWRLGRNEATTIESTGKLVVAGKELEPGKYTLWAKKTGDDSWVIGFHPTTTQPNGKPLWGVPELKEGYVAELPLKPEKAKDTAELLTISLKPAKNQAELVIHWGGVEQSGMFGVK